MQRGNPTEVGKAFGEFARAHGVEITQGHLWLKVKMCVDESAVGILKDWLDLYDAIGVKAAVLHCDRFADFPEVDAEEKIRRNVEALKELCAHIEGREINICLENLRESGGLCSTAEELLHIIDLVGSKNLAICLDTGHLNIHSDRDQEKFILTAGKLLKALHIADNDRSADQHIMPYGRGTVNWTKVMKNLKKIGYDGLFNYEIPGERVAPAEVKTAKLQYIKTLSAVLDSIE